MTTGDDIRALTALDAPTVAGCVYDAIRHCATHLRPDVLAAVRAAAMRETSERARSVLASVIENADIAARDGVPLCQDTGSVWVDIEAGPDQTIPGTLFSEVDNAVARAYADGALRKSIVADALVDRTNTTTNAPAFCELHLRECPGASLTVMLKGGGSDNASSVTMLPPAAGRDGILQTVIDWVRLKAANACPPLILGIGIGATFDTVGHLAKTALLRPVGQPNENPEIAAFERELLDAVNATGLGPGALGGATTALGVAINTAPCHIAALPLAINMGCIAMRSITIPLVNSADAGDNGDDGDEKDGRRAHSTASLDDVTITRNTAINGNTRPVDETANTRDTTLLTTGDVSALAAESNANRPNAKIAGNGAPDA